MYSKLKLGKLEYMKKGGEKKKKHLLAVCKFKEAKT